MGRTRISSSSRSRRSARSALCPDRRRDDQAQDRRRRRSSAASAAPAQPMARVLVASHDLAVGTRLDANDLDLAGLAGRRDQSGLHHRRPGRPPSGADRDRRARRAGQPDRQGRRHRRRRRRESDGAALRLDRARGDPGQRADHQRQARARRRGRLHGRGPAARHARRRRAGDSVNTAAGGFILPGDRVDVVQARPSDRRQTAAGRLSWPQTLLRNVRVLAIDQNSQPPKNGQQSQVGATATLEVAAADTRGARPRQGARRSHPGATALLRRRRPSGPPADQGIRFRPGPHLPQRPSPPKWWPCNEASSSASLRARRSAARVAGARRRAARWRRRDGRQRPMQRRPRRRPAARRASPSRSGKSAIVDLPVDARDVLVTNPQVADAVLRSPRRIYVSGLPAGDDRRRLLRRLRPPHPGAQHPGRPGLRRRRPDHQPADPGRPRSGRGGQQRA